MWDFSPNINILRFLPYLRSSVSSRTVSALPCTLDTRKCFQAPFMVCIRNCCLAGSACSWQLSRHLPLGLLCLLGVLFSDILCSVEQSNLFLLWKAPCFTVTTFGLRKGGIWIVLKHWNYVGSEIVSDRDVLMLLLRNQFLYGSPTSSECPQSLGFTPVLWIYYHHYWWATAFVFTMWLSSEEPERLKMCPVVWREAAESEHVLMRLTPVLSRPWLLQKAAGRTRLASKGNRQ